MSETNVATKLTQLLARCDQLRRGSDLPTTFDQRGQREAERIAARDRTASPGGVVRRAGP